METSTSFTECYINVFESFSCIRGLFCWVNCQNMGKGIVAETPFSPVPLLKEKYDRQIKILLFKCQIKVYLLGNIKMHCVAWEIRRQKVLCLNCVTMM